MNEEKSILEPAPPDAATQRILLVDDDVSIRKILAMGFQLEGFETVEAPDGQAALDLLDETPVDIILVDLMMPVMNGVTFIETVRGTLGLATPVFMLTSFDREGSEDDAMNAGATGLIRKPANVREILDVFRAHHV